MAKNYNQLGRNFKINTQIKHVSLDTDRASLMSTALLATGRVWWNENSQVGQKVICMKDIHFTKLMRSMPCLGKSDIYSVTRAWNIPVPCASFFLSWAWISNYFSLSTVVLAGLLCKADNRLGWITLTYSKVCLSQSRIKSGQLVGCNIRKCSSLRVAALALVTSCFPFLSFCSTVASDSASRTSIILDMFSPSSNNEFNILTNLQLQVSPHKSGRSPLCLALSSEQHGLSFLSSSFTNQKSHARAA